MGGLKVAHFWFNTKIMEQIIGLRGRAGSGKSPTFRILHEQLDQDERFTPEMTTYNGVDGELRSIFIFQDVRFGLNSTGDSFDDVQQQLQLLQVGNCQFAVSACRTYDRRPPGTNAAIRQFSDVEPIFIRKEIIEESNNQERLEANRRDAQRLVDLIIRSCQR